MSDSEQAPLRFSRRLTILAGVGTVAAMTGTKALPAGAAPDEDDRQGRFERSTLWTRGENGWVDFRVHAVDVTPAGTSLAFSEARVGTSDDDGPKDLVVRRSVDGGRTWTGTDYLERHEGGAWANPTPVVDRRTGHITLWYANNDKGQTTRVFRRTSTDDGLSWSDRVDMTDLFTGNGRGWTFHLPGPGRGIQLADGRLLVEVWHRRGLDLPAAERDYGVSVIFSDDGGRSWHWGGVVPDPDGLGLDEARVTQVGNGDVLVNSRLASGRSNSSRAVARSRDGGLTFSAAVIETNIAPHAGVATGLGTRIDRKRIERVIYTSPVAGTARDTLYARISHDRAASWSWGRVIDDARAGYSDLVWLDDSTLLVLYSRLGDSGAETREVVAARFDLTWLTSGRDAVGSGPNGLRNRYQVEGLRAKSAVERAPMIIDSGAAGDAVTRVPATAPNDTYRVAVVPVTSGRRLLRCRFRSPEETGGADLVVRVDGRQRGGVVATSAGDPFLDVDLGLITVRALRPVSVEFIACGAAPAGTSYEFLIDEISLISPGDT